MQIHSGPLVFMINLINLTSFLFILLFQSPVKFENYDFPFPPFYHIEA